MASIVRLPSTSLSLTLHQVKEQQSIERKLLSSSGWVPYTLKTKQKIRVQRDNRLHKKVTHTRPTTQVICGVQEMCTGGKRKTKINFSIITIDLTIQTTSRCGSFLGSIAQFSFRAASSQWRTAERYIRNGSGSVGELRTFRSCGISKPKKKLTVDDPNIDLVILFQNPWVLVVEVWMNRMRKQLCLVHDASLFLSVSLVPMLCKRRT